MRKEAFKLVLDAPRLERRERVALLRIRKLLILAAAYDTTILGRAKIEIRL